MGDSGRNRPLLTIVEGAPRIHAVGVTFLSPVRITGSQLTLTQSTFAGAGGWQPAAL